MSGMGRRFDPDEIRPDAGPGPSDAELAEAMLAARELEALGARDAVGPTVGFEDRVMTAIATEPAPRVLVRAGRNVRYGLLGGFAISVSDAWRVATGGGRPLVMRAQAMAFVLLVVLATSSLSVFAVVGASSLLTSGPTPTPSVPAPTVSPAPPSPSPLTAPSAVPSPSPTPSPASSQMVEPSPTGEPGTSAEPTDTAEPTETNKAKTPKPTKTPRATETPEPTETDEAEGTDDHGGAGGDDGGDDGGGDDDDSSGPGGGD